MPPTGSPPSTRPLRPGDLPSLAPLLTAEARARAASLPALRRLEPDPGAAATAAIRAVMEDPAPAVRHVWFVAGPPGAAMGLVHALHLPVPPIYAGVFGPPGLIMADGALAPDAPEGTATALLDAAERALTGGGARLLLAAAFAPAPGEAPGPWAQAIRAAGYAPLTLYLAKDAFAPAAPAPPARPATAADLPGIVARSAGNRRLLHALDPFWEPHPEADARFGAWMRRSLTLPDRDMLVDEAGAGYAVAQPATALHVPPGHASGGVGMLDDFFHESLADPHGRGEDAGAEALLAAAEGAFAARGLRSALAVCPAAWTSKRRLLERRGWRAALEWRIRRPVPG